MCKRLLCTHKLRVCQFCLALKESQPPYALIVARLEGFMRKERVLSAREWIQYRILPGTQFHFLNYALYIFFVPFWLCVKNESICMVENHLARLLGAQELLELCYLHTLALKWRKLQWISEYFKSEIYNYDFSAHKLNAVLIYVKCDTQKPPDSS